MEMKRGYAIAVFAIILLAFLVQYLSNPSSVYSITGRATTGTTSPTITVANAAPVIGNVSMGNFGTGTITIVENNYTIMNLSFNVHDSNGLTDILPQTARVNLTNNGTTNVQRFNYSCSSPNNYSGTNSRNVSCAIQIWYYDIAGVWNVSVQINDSAASRAQNYTQVTIGDTVAMVVEPSSLTFPAVTVGADNTVADRNITINNTGNHNHTLLGSAVENGGRINVTAYTLIGADPVYNITAQNFSVRNIGAATEACHTESFMANGTTKNITNSSLPPGDRDNATFGGGSEAIFVCLYDAPVVLTSQTYTATGGNAWVVSLGN